MTEKILPQTWDLNLGALDQQTRASPTRAPYSHHFDKGTEKSDLPWSVTLLQIRRGNLDNLGIIFNIPQTECMLGPLIKMSQRVTGHSSEGSKLMFCREIRKIILKLALF